jgi:hypothetical protein
MRGQRMCHDYVAGIFVYSTNVKFPTATDVSDGIFYWEFSLRFEGWCVELMFIITYQ